MYAVIETGGKQYRVQAGDIIAVEKLSGDVGSSIKLNQVLLVSKPGEKMEMHSHPAHIVYGLTSGKEKFTSADGKTEERELKAGRAARSDAVTHSSENTGTTEDRALVIELKK